MVGDSNPEHILKLIDSRIEALKRIAVDLEVKIPQWKSRTHHFLAGKIAIEELAIFNNINTDTWAGDQKAYLEFLKEIRDGVIAVPDMYLVAEEEPSASGLQADSVGTQRHHSAASSNVFVVHGYDDTTKLDVARTIEKLGLNAIILHEQPNQGRTLIEKFEASATDVGFAVILLTPDDMGFPNGKPDSSRPRARQNVVLELGYFCGLLGRKRVCVLYRGDVEIPSDYLGVVYTAIDKAGSWRFALAKELKETGLDVDLNTLA